MAAAPVAEPFRSSLRKKTRLVNHASRRKGGSPPDHLTTPTWRFQLYPLPFQETCSFLDDQSRCTIYSTRPDVCRDFSAGGDQCQTARIRNGLPPLPPNLEG